MRRFLCLLTLLLPTVFAEATAGKWIAVIAPDLREAIQPLAEQRKSEGWDVLLLPAPEGEDLSATLEKVASLANDTSPLCLVLVGDMEAKQAGARVAPGRGGHVRMKDKPTDRPWNLIAGKAGRIETGRLPARSAEEAAAMVKKILAWPKVSQLGGPFPQTRFIIGSHHAPPQYTILADRLVNSLAERMAKRLPSAWALRALVHINDSPWQVSGQELGPAAEEMMQSRSTILAYMGHSAVEGAISMQTNLLAVQHWRQLPPNSPNTGLFFTCGCHACELGTDREAHGFAAMRAPGGPAAVIGSHGVTYAAMGYLALSGMLDALNADPTPNRLGLVWKGVQQGLAEGQIARTEFTMLDMVDGSNGLVPLHAQRLEHLESWMLLGDPAMPLLPSVPSIRMNAGRPKAGEPFTVTGEVPASLAGANLRVTFERHPGVPRADLPDVPAKGQARVNATRTRRKMSEEVILASVETKASGNLFNAVLPLPSSLPPSPWTIRVVLTDNPTSAAGILRLP